MSNQKITIELTGRPGDDWFRASRLASEKLADLIEAAKVSPHSGVNAYIAKVRETYLELLAIVERTPSLYEQYKDAQEEADILFRRYLQERFGPNTVLRVFKDPNAQLIEMRGPVSLEMTDSPVQDYVESEDVYKALKRRATSYFRELRDHLSKQLQTHFHEFSKNEGVEEWLSDHQIHLIDRLVHSLMYKMYPHCSDMIPEPPMPPISLPGELLDLADEDDSPPLTQKGEPTCE